VLARDDRTGLPVSRAMSGAEGVKDSGDQAYPVLNHLNVTDSGND
jgi:hypothetical protein